MNSARAERIRRAVAAGFRRWPHAAAAPAQATAGTPQDGLNVVRSMPRRKITHSPASAAVVLPRVRRVVFKPGIIRPVFRLFAWVWGATQFFCGNGYDFVLRRHSIQGRASRLRRVFEEAGPSLAKLGQQLSLRADILPYAYCAELGKMLDQVPPFPTPQAIAIIERSLGRQLHEVFDAFDPDPIGSASLACVYQATLKTGERVAVKVRRPGIGQMLAADLRAFDWLLNVAETLTLIRPGLTGRFRQDLRTMLFNELNFRAEARYTDLFRRRSKKRGEVTAPKVYFKYCTEEVMVSELVSGVWMWELIAAVDSNDQEFLQTFRARGIEPKSLARKIVRIMQRELLEEMFYHADPHPANIVVLPDNKLCFIDFGAIGRFSTQTRKGWRELQYHVMQGDITRMVHASLNFAGPLPPMDVHRLASTMEQVYADWVFAMMSKDAEWWERSSASAWLRYIEVAQEYGVPVSLETIQLFRATLLYDSIITRLNRQINVAREYQVYAQQAAKEARKRVRKTLRQRLVGPTDMDYLVLEQVFDTATQFMFKLQRSVEDPLVHFRNIVGKIAYTASLLLRMGYLAAALAGIALLTDSIWKSWTGNSIDWSGLLRAGTSFGWIQLILIVCTLVIIRRIVIRLSQPDKRVDPER
jgi:predicted unusual protein kinase regulating ubiquinone biosynthesis (AarF/ABC1/UbiB family)